jgi:hypothetical protein
MFYIYAAFSQKTESWAHVISYVVVDNEKTWKNLIHKGKKAFFV